MSLLLWAQRRQAGPTKFFDFRNGVPTDFSYSRAGAALDYNSSGLLTSYASNIPRIGYDPYNLTPLGICLEGSATNLNTLGECTGWTLNGVSADIGTTETLDIYGSNIATKLTETLVSEAHRAYNGAAIPFSATNYTFSFFAKAGTATVIQLTAGTPFSGTRYINFDLLNGVVGGSLGFVGGMQKLRNGWYRCWAWSSAPAISSIGAILCLADNNPASAKTPIYVGQGRHLYVCSTQVETGTIPTSYIPTSGATATRASDEIINSSISSWFNPISGTFGVKATNSLSWQAYMKCVTFDNGGTTNRLMIATNSSRQAFANLVSGGVSKEALSSTTIPDESPYKAAFRYASGDNAMYANGSRLSINDTMESSGVPSGITTLRIGRQSGSTERFFGHIESVSYWNTPLQDSKLQGATSL